MKKLLLAVLLLALLPGCEDSPTSPTVRTVHVPFSPNVFAGTWSGDMRSSNGVFLSGTVMTIVLQEGAAAIGEWRSTGLIGTPGSAAIFLIYRGEMTFTLQPDNATLVGRWNVDVVDPDDETVLCSDSSDFRGTLSSHTTMTIASDGFSACNSLPGVAPQGVIVFWTKITGPTLNP